MRGAHSIFNNIRNYFFLASGGQGAFLKNRPLHPQKTFVYFFRFRVKVNRLLIDLALLLEDVDESLRTADSSGHTAASSPAGAPITG